MNYGLAKEIYGLTPWCVDAVSFQSLSAILKNIIHNGVSLDIPEQKYNSISVINVSNETRIISRPFGDDQTPGQLDNNDDFDGIGVINLNGPITKCGGASSSGMIELSNQMLSMSKDSRIKGFIVLTDSGGGSSGAVDIMGDAIQEVKKTKPVYSLVTKGGMAGSAAYGIVSNSTKIFAEDKLSIVGSVGTMISMEGHKANTTDPNGTKHITIYASKSTEKNKAFEEAFNNDNYELIINDLLDPINEAFIGRTLQNRPQLEGTDFDNGHTKFAKDSVGTFIDGIASFDEVVQMVLNDSKNNINSNLSLTNSTKKMTKEEIKQAHPEVYAGIVTEGASAERERVKSLLTYIDADSKTVIECINSGDEISPSQREAFLVKMNSANMLGSLNSDSEKQVVVEETAVVIAEAAEEENKTDAVAEIASMYKKTINK